MYKPYAISYNREKVVSVMQVIVHYPKSKASQTALTKNIAEVHAKSVLEYIQKMEISKEETEKLISLICEKVKFLESA